MALVALLPDPPTQCVEEKFGRRVIPSTEPRHADKVAALAQRIRSRQTTDDDRLKLAGLPRAALRVLGMTPREFVLLMADVHAAY